MLQHAYLLAKIGTDTAENERNFDENLLKLRWHVMSVSRHLKLVFQCMDTDGAGTIESNEVAKSSGPADGASRIRSEVNNFE